MLSHSVVTRVNCTQKASPHFPRPIRPLRVHTTATPWMAAKLQGVGVKVTASETAGNKPEAAVVSS